MDEVGINSLPENLLVQIFEDLSTRDLLLGTQYVCRSWRRICRDAKLWRERGVALNEVSDWPVVIRALHAAPVLASLQLCYEVLERCPLDMGAALRDSPCRLGSIVVKGTCADLGTLRDVLQLLDKQQPHLRQLDIALDGSAWDSDGAGDRFFQSLSHMERLRTLDLLVWASAVSSDFRVPERRGRHASLTRLNIVSLCESLRLGRGVETLIAAHAPTLRDVFLPSSAHGSTVGMLARCPNLSAVSVPGVSEVSRLRSCRITDLEIRTFSLGWEGRRVLSYIRDTTSLQEITVHGIEDGMGELLEAVRDSKSAPGLKELVLHVSSDVFFGWDGDAEWVVADLAAGLLKFPLLEKLGGSTGSLTAPLIEAVTPATTPNLRIFVASGSCTNCGDECFLPALRRLLQRFPSLHIEDFDGEAYADDQATAMCWPEHSAAGALDSTCALYAHADTDKCEECERLRERNYMLVRLV